MWCHEEQIWGITAGFLVRWWQQKVIIPQGFAHLDGPSYQGYPVFHISCLWCCHAGKGLGLWLRKKVGAKDNLMGTRFKDPEIWETPEKHLISFCSVNFQGTVLSEKSLSGYTWKQIRQNFLRERQKKQQKEHQWLPHRIAFPSHVKSSEIPNRMTHFFTTATKLRR